MITDPIAKLLISIGIVIVILGVAWQLGWIQALRLGRLPGDISVERENFRFYLPITTSLLLSLIISLILWIARRLW